MNVGEMVELKRWCKDSDRLAIITEVPSHLNCVKIMYVDTFETATALKTNLILLEAK